MDTEWTDDWTQNIICNNRDCNTRDVILHNNLFDMNWYEYQIIDQKPNTKSMNTGLNIHYMTHG